MSADCLCAVGQLEEFSPDDTCAGVPGSHLDTCMRIVLRGGCRANSAYPGTRIARIEELYGAMGVLGQSRPTRRQNRAPISQSLGGGQRPTFLKRRQHEY